MTTPMVDQPAGVPDDAPLWRYLSFSKLIALFSQRALYFSRPDGFLDPFEGALGRAENWESVMGVWDGIAEAMGAGIAAGPSDGSEPAPRGGHTYQVTIDDEVVEKAMELTGGDLKELGRRLAQDVAAQMRKDASEAFKREYDSTFICCWHCSDHESEAMWRLYAKDTAEGVAVRTTAGLLRNSVINERELIIRPVDYRDDYVYEYSQDRLARFFTKRLAFQHEKEARAIIVDRQAGLRGDRGILVPVNVTDLILRVVVSPYAPPWMAATLSDVARRFGIPAEITSSKLNTKAFHY
jgi:hypothetical protein